MGSTSSTIRSAHSTARRCPQEGQSPRLLQENGTSFSSFLLQSGLIVALTPRAGPDPEDPSVSGDSNASAKRCPSGLEDSASSPGPAADPQPAHDPAGASGP